MNRREVHEEWAVERPDPVDSQPRYDRFATLEAALDERWEGDRVVRRFVTDWETVDATESPTERLARELSAVAGVDFDEQEPDGADMLMKIANHVLGWGAGR